MGNDEATIALVMGLAIALFVPALVWARVIAGLYQIVREKVRKSRIVRLESLREAPQPVRSN